MCQQESWHRFQRFQKVQGRKQKDIDRTNRANALLKEGTNRIIEITFKILKEK